MSSSFEQSTAFGFTESPAHARNIGLLDVDCQCPVQVVARSRFGQMTGFPYQYRGTWSAVSVADVITSTPAYSYDVFNDLYVLGNESIWTNDAYSAWHTQIGYTANYASRVVQNRYDKITVVSDCVNYEYNGTDWVAVTWYYQNITEYDADVGYLKSRYEILKRDGSTYYERTYTMATDGTESDTITGARDSYIWMQGFPVVTLLDDYEADVVITETSGSIIFTYPVTGGTASVDVTVTMSQPRTLATIMTESEGYLGSITGTIGSTITGCITSYDINDDPVTEDVTVAWGDRFYVFYRAFPKDLVCELVERPVSGCVETNYEFGRWLGAEEIPPDVSDDGCFAAKVWCRVCIDCYESFYTPITIRVENSAAYGSADNHTSDSSGTLTYYVPPLIIGATVLLGVEDIPTTNHWGYGSPCAGDYIP